MDRHDLQQQLQAVGLSRIAKALVGLAQESIVMHRHRSAEDAIPLGASKLGGRPDVPPDFHWPETDGIPQSFVAQVNCAEAKPFDPTGLLPETGLLYLFIDQYRLANLGRTPDPFWDGPFYELENWTDRYTYYAGDRSTLHRHALPSFLIEHSVDYAELYFRPCEVRFARALTLASDFAKRLEALDLTESESTAYSSLYRRDEGIDGVHTPQHQLFGNPSLVQYDPTPGDDWYLLLQIDWDDEAQFHFGDGGVVQLWIRRKDLQRRDFTHMHFDVQMS